MIPDILATNPDDATKAIQAIALKHADKEIELRKTILESPNIDKLTFSKLDGQEFILFVLTCLAYTRVDTELRHIPLFKDKLIKNTSAILSNLSLSENMVVPLSSIEERLYSILK